MKVSMKLLPLLGVFAILPAISGLVPESESELDGFLSAWAKSMEGLEIYVSQSAGGAPLGSSILALVNAADLPTLDVDAGLYAQAAKSLIGYREAGPDLQLGTADDDFVSYTRIFGSFHTNPNLDIDFLTHESTQGCIDNDGGVSCAFAATTNSDGHEVTTYLRTPFVP